jgi:hypothetical protein
MTTNWQQLWQDLNKKFARPYRDKEANFAHLVPIDPLENIKFRQEIHRRCMANPKLAKAVRLACKRDILFWVRAFGWLLEPRRISGSKIIPFLPWPIQEEALHVLDENFGKRDVLVDKSRDTGVSWLFLHRDYHRWAFFPDMHIALGSRNEDAVDNPDDPDSLMQKLDFIWEHQPSYLRPKRRRTKLRMANVWLRGTIFGYPFSGNFTRGGRKIQIDFDEFGFPINPGEDSKVLASTQNATNARTYVSTIPGPWGEFYRLREKCLHDRSKPAELITIDWKNVPERRAGLYTSIDGRLIIIDKDYVFPSPYDFVLDGRIRSIYYDREWHRSGGNRRLIARELDRDAGVAGAGFFEESHIEAMQSECFSPLQVGMLHRDGRDVEFVETINGPLSLWCVLSENSLAQPDDYVIACDLCAGTASALTNNSVAHVMNKRTGEQVAEYVTNREKPEQFAESVYALAIMFHNAKVNFENNSALGTNFQKQLMDELSYRNVRMHKSDEDVKGKRNKRKAGWHNGKGGKLSIFGPWLVAISRKRHIIRSERIAREAKCYVYWKDGKVIYKSPEGHEEDVEEGLAHGDRVVAAALAYMLLSEYPVEQSNDGRMLRIGIESAPKDTVGHRIRQSMRPKEEVWDY